MIQCCKTCNKTFDNLKQISLCPHPLFPSKCEKHNRFHCGNLECDTENVMKEIERLNIRTLKVIK